MYISTYVRIAVFGDLVKGPRSKGEHRYSARGVLRFWGRQRDWKNNRKSVSRFRRSTIAKHISVVGDKSCFSYVGYHGYKRQVVGLEKYCADRDT